MSEIGKKIDLYSLIVNSITKIILYSIVTLGIIFTMKNLAGKNTKLDLKAFVNVFADIDLELVNKFSLLMWVLFIVMILVTIGLTLLYLRERALRRRTIEDCQKEKEIYEKLLMKVRSSSGLEKDGNTKKGD